LIPQRNLSLLANRLAKAGGRRIPESVLERDYCLAWFLAELAESDLQQSLAFKGGTALKRKRQSNPSVQAPALVMQWKGGRTSAGSGSWATPESRGS
jgi:hypothetical protein